MNFLIKYSDLKEYHNFSDKRNILGIPNGYNVISNIAILLPAIYLILKQKKISFLSTNLILLAITSGYYHMDPNDDTIFLDMIFVISVYTIFLSYFIEKDKAEILYIIGILSVFYWKKTNNILFYELLKVIILLYGFYKIYKTNLSKYILPIIITSILIKISEYNDNKIYKLTNKTISGHTLKHFIAGIQICILIFIIKNKI